MAKLKGTEPASVPAKRAIGQVRLTNRNGTSVDAAIPTDSGTLHLHLHLLVTDGQWLVDAIDWERT
jgi:hypothetical protein